MHQKTKFSVKVGTKIRGDPDIFWATEPLKVPKISAEIWQAYLRKYLTQAYKSIWLVLLEEIYFVLIFLHLHIKRFIIFENENKRIWLIERVDYFMNFKKSRRKIFPTIFNWISNSFALGISIKDMY